MCICNSYNVLTVAIMPFARQLLIINKQCNLNKHKLLQCTNSLGPGVDSVPHTTTLIRNLTTFYSRVNCMPHYVILSGGTDNVSPKLYQQCHNI